VLVELTIVATTAVENINNLTLDRQQNSQSFMQIFMMNAQTQQEERRQERLEAERQRHEERQIRKEEERQRKEEERQRREEERQRREEEERQRREERREELQMFIAALIKK